MNETCPLCGGDLKKSSIGMGMLECKDCGNVIDSEDMEEIYPSK